MAGFFSIFGGRKGKLKANGRNGRNGAAAPPPMIPPGEIRIVQDEPEEEGPFGVVHLADPEARFIHEGEWHSNFTSSNVAAYHYDLRGQFDNAPETLVIEYKDGSFYGYSPVSEALARSLFNAGSKGTWVWDNLRVRGTVFGYQVPYFFMASRSRATRLWMATQASRLQHAAVSPSGEPFKGFHPLLNPGGQREPGTKTPVAAKIGFGGRARGGENERNFG